MAILTIKALLLDPKINVIAADIDRLAAGLSLADKGYIVPPINDKQFFDKIKWLVRREKVHVIIPCLDTFLLPFAEKRKEFHEMGTELILSPIKTIGICRDKWLLYQFLHETIAMPKSIIPNITERPYVRFTRGHIGFPVIIKPRMGSGSQNVFIANNDEELEFFLGKVSSPIIQEQVSGQEYTVDMLVNKEHEPLAIIPRKRLEVKAGISVKGLIEMNKEIINLGQEICSLLKFFGPVNIQLFLNKKDNKLKITEINPRIAGGMSLTVAAGINMPLLSIYLALGKKIKIEPVRNKLYMSRYFEEIIFDSEESQNFKKI